MGHFKEVEAMLKARKGNRVLRIPDEKKDAYIALGYTITDLDGNMIHEHVEPTLKLEELEKENETLKAKLDEATEYAEKADNKIAELEKENEALKATPKAATEEPKTKKATKATSEADK